MKVHGRRDVLALAVLAFAIVASVGGGAGAATKAPTPATEPRNEPHAEEKFFERATQQMCDAVAIGDTAVWSRYMVGDCLITDEEGNTMTKARFLAELHPLPKGYRGTIRVTHPRVVMFGETAALTTDLDETLTLYGQTLKTRFHATSTWMRQLDGWKMLAQQTQVLPSEHRAVSVDPAAFTSYAGTYALAPDVTYTVTRQGKKLFGQRSGRDKEELYPLGGDHFFRKGANRGERIFARDSTGHVARMIDRRDNNDLVWRRVE